MQGLRNFNSHALILRYLRICFIKNGVNQEGIRSQKWDLTQKRVVPSTTTSLVHHVAEDGRLRGDICKGKNMFGSIKKHFITLLEVVRVTLEIVT